MCTIDLHCLLINSKLAT
ncbi:hypothetical protein VCHENC02_5069A, partial [Vibrio harveyi]